MVTWQGNAPRSWPHRQPSSSMPQDPIAGEQDLDASEALHETDARVEQAEAALAPGKPPLEQRAAGRLRADQLIVEAILEEGLHRTRHLELEDALIRYAVPVLRQLLSDGRIVSKATQLGRPPGCSEAWLDFTKAELDEFARDMVADALPVFTKAVFEQRRWSPDRGASLKTYFVNACILQFPRLYRDWLGQRQAVWPAGLEIDPGGDSLASDPAITVALRDEASRMLRNIPDEKIKEVLILRGAGYTAEEAAQLAGLTPKAAESKLARIRKNLKGERDSTEPADSRQQDTTQGGRWAK